ncbi:protein adenylyltransferase SelO [Dokdonella sp.]|uniref:protein adenylyltransferase SelO n=1 Tax=Dokdonella sp. TaxID=2291710 RepID=UPI003C68DB37
MTPFQFDNAFVRDLPGDPVSGSALREVRGAAWSHVGPTAVVAPRLVAHSMEAAELLDIPVDEVRSQQFADIFGGNSLMDGMQPFAANYGGHQFGHWAGQLGDGRAISLGEVINTRDQRWELQLKGAGPTPYSRSADGRAVMRSSIREFLCSEAMHHLGVPTTRALSLVATGESVVRDMFYDGNPAAEAGAVVCRVAPSFIRFGTFELPSSRGELALLNQLIDFTIQRDFAHLEGKGETLRADWFAEVCERTARMIAHWMRVGFVHGVMNTDNMSILGLTIDYGPYGWIDNFDPDWTPNTTDRQNRRYRFGQQANVAHWNLASLAQALAPAFGSIEPLQDGLKRYAESYNRAERSNIAAKLGLLECRDDDVAMMQDLYELMTAAEIDMTIFFRSLSDAGSTPMDPDSFRNAFYDESKRQQSSRHLQEWLGRYAQRLGEDAQSSELRRERMRAINPKYVLRNWLAQQAIDKAASGDESEIHVLLDVMRRPYEDQPEREAYASRRPDWARNKAGCSMLSCSS